MSQIAIIPSARSILAGVGEPSRPGSIQIWLKYSDRPMEKINEVQAHSRPVERMKLSYDSQNLFSIGQDGLLCLFEVRDSGKTPHKRQLDFSEEILTESIQMDKLNKEIEDKKSEFYATQQPD